MIAARNVSKAYRLGSIGATSLKEELARLWTRARRRSSRPVVEDFWALRDVSFDVQPGEVVGIIGRNGAGKSTLLKILSRITAQTAGEIRLRGRIASLLEVGTGFHPDLTGRENIFLNGAILGMSKHEIRRKLDEIVGFAEIEPFIDTPVKRYSSGMYVRLAFAVAAHLEPEILIVDEVLAVGDLAFQQKCLGKMGNAARSGRTILFVSHNLPAIQNLCQRAILLDRGHVVGDGPSESIVREHVALNANFADVTLANRTDRNGTGLVRMSSVSFTDGAGAPVNALTCGAASRLIVRFENIARRRLRNVRLDIGIDDQLGQRVALLSTGFTTDRPLDLEVDIDTIEVRIDRMPLMSDRYAFTLYFAVGGEAADWVQNAGVFDVEAGDFFKTGKVLSRAGGRLLIDHRFTVGTSRCVTTAGS